MAAVRRLILKGGSLPEGVVGVCEALEDLRSFDELYYRHSLLEWGGLFQRHAQRILGDVEAAAGAGAADPVTLIYRKRQTAGLTEPSRRAEAKAIHHEWLFHKASYGEPVLAVDTIRRRLRALGHGGARRAPQ
jgi:hypothetical protein